MCYILHWKQSYSCFREDKTETQRHYVARPQSLLCYLNSNMGIHPIIHDCHLHSAYKVNSIGELDAHLGHSSSKSEFFSNLSFKTPSSKAWSRDSSSIRVKCPRSGGQSGARLWLISFAHKTSMAGVFLCSHSHSHFYTLTPVHFHAPGLPSQLHSALPSNIFCPESNRLSTHWRILSEDVRKRPLCPVHFHVPGLPSQLHSALPSNIFCPESNRLSTHWRILSEDVRKRPLFVKIHCER